MHLTNGFIGEVTLDKTEMNCDIHMDICVLQLNIGCPDEVDSMLVKYFE